MALNTEINKIEYSPSAGQTVFADWNIPYFNDNDVVVTIETVNGTIYTYNDETNFTVAATNGDPSNGATITLVANTPVTGGLLTTDTVVISRDVPYTQNYNLLGGASIDPFALNTAFDRTVAQSQQLRDEGERHITHPITDPSTLTYEAPAVVERAGKAAGWDTSGNVVALNLVDSGTVSGNENAGITVTNNQISAKVDDTTTEFDVSGNIAVKDAGIDSDQLATDSVTNAKIGTGAVDTDELATDAVTLAKIDADASLTVRGVIEQATDDETRTGSDTDRAVSPSNITALFEHSSRALYATEGFQLLPGGFLMKWGHTDTGAGLTATITFQSTIPFSAVYSVNAQQARAAGAVVNSNLQCHSVTTTGMGILATEVGTEFDYFVIGKA